MSTHTVHITKLAEKQLLKAPKHIVRKLRDWMLSVEFVGLETASSRSSFHDEPLQGKRQGQRSIRLNKQWRAIYQLDTTHTPIIIRIEEVTPHDYRVR
jgi:proteic killer suppression protein